MAKPSGNFPLIYCLVGRINVNWSYFEMTLGQCVGVLHSSCGGHTICPDMPRTAFNKKRDFIRACMKQLLVLQPFAADFLSLLERATDLSRERNEKIHGAIFAEEGQQEKFLFVGWDFKQASPKIRRREVTLNDLDDLGKRMEHLNREMVRIAARLFDHFGR